MKTRQTGKHQAWDVELSDGKEWRLYSHHRKEELALQSLKDAAMHKLERRLVLTQKTYFVPEDH